MFRPLRRYTFGTDCLILALKAGHDLQNLIQAKSKKSEQQLECGGSGRGPVWIFLYFDEAHMLTEQAVDFWDDKTNRIVPRSLYMALCSALNGLSEIDLFGLFLSTSSALSRFAPPMSDFWSARGMDKTHDLQTPFVELPFDVQYGDTNMIFNEGSCVLQEVCTIEKMAHLSRPLYVVTDISVYFVLIRVQILYAVERGRRRYPEHVLGLRKN